MAIRHFRVVIFGALILAACASPIRQAEDFAAQDEWLKAVLEYRKASTENPKDVEYRSRLRQAELKAADFYYQRGARQLEQGNVDGAIVEFQQGLAALPDHSKLQQAMGDALARKESGALYDEGVALRDAGKLEDARGKFQRALQAYPRHQGAAAAESAMESAEREESEGGLALSSRTPVTLNFRQIDLKQAFEFLARSFGINIIFDEGLKSVPVTLMAKDVTFEQGLNLLLTTTKSFSKRIGPNTLLIAPDTKEKRGQYEDHLVRSFSLNTVRAKEMADILKGLLTIKKLVVNEQLNTLVVRDTTEVLRVAERIIEANDRKPAEMILDVEILEVNRNKAERLGLDLGGYQISATVPAFPIGTAWATARDAGTLTIPATTFRFFKQDVDAKTLANPKIRVMHGRAAKIHIGDRVPLRAATIQDSTGQIRTTYDYREIGIRLLAEPTINLDNSTLVKLGLEVSTLGENLGTANEPAFRIGTRNADTFMLLRDGETAILGGMIRDEERNTRVRVPGLGDIPIVGALFTSYDDSSGRTDVLLTITPRVVRGWDLPPPGIREFYSGTENVVSDQPVIPEIQVAEAISGTDRPRQPGMPGATPTPTGPTSVAAESSRPSPRGRVPKLAFDLPTYEVAPGQEVEIRLTAADLGGIGSLPVDLLFNPQLLEFVAAERGDVSLSSYEVETGGVNRGLLGLRAAVSSAAAEETDNRSATLMRVRLRGTKEGVSYLVYRANEIRLADGTAATVTTSASRVAVR